MGVNETFFQRYSKTGFIMVELGYFLRSCLLVLPSGRDSFF